MYGLCNQQCDSKQVLMTTTQGFYSATAKNKFDIWVEMSLTYLITVMSVNNKFAVYRKLLRLKISTSINVP